MLRTDLEQLLWEQRVPMLRLAMSILRAGAAQRGHAAG